jgi:hypothetical protein
MYSETVSAGQRYKKFMTTLMKTVDVKSAEEFTKESDKLFAQAKMLTERDIAKIIG